jgi:hypothetical protein
LSRTQVIDDAILNSKHSVYFSVFFVGSQRALSDLCGLCPGG